MKTTKKVEILSFEKQQKLVVFTEKTEAKYAARRGSSCIDTHYNTSYKILDLSGKQLLAFEDHARDLGFFRGFVSKIYCYQDFFVRAQCDLEVHTDGKKERSSSFQAYTYKGNLINRGFEKWTGKQDIVDYYNSIADEVDEEAYDRANQDY